MDVSELDSLLTRAGRLESVIVETLEGQTDFPDLAARFAHLPGTVVLLSGGDLDCARYHLMGVMPWLTFAFHPPLSRLTIDGQHIETTGDPLELLRTLLDRFHLPGEHWPMPMAAGLMGYLAYDLKDCLERLPRSSVDDTRLPHLLFYAPSIIVVHDQHTGATHITAPRRSGQKDDAHAAIARFRETAAGPLPETAGFRADAGALQSNFTRQAYEKAVQRVIDYIAAGDVYQVNLSQRFRVPFEGDGFALFRRLYERNPAPFFAFVQAGDHQVVSTSPERFLHCDGKHVETRPIKGTRPRGGTAAEDQALREELLQSKKDDAELSMIVDLLRNDIGRVCAAGSVKVDQHKRLEAYQNVYHLVSVVKGKLDAGMDRVDLIAAAFPGGSITGCPKVRAMEIIDELESHRRHVYCGSIGYLSFHGTMDLSIAIRTATVVNDTLTFSVGGGIVFDSDPRLEYEETLHKGQTLINTCQGSAVRRPESLVWLNGRLTGVRSANLSVDDQGVLYGYGFFETIRVDSGRAPLLADHLARFESTWQALMPGPCPDVTWETVLTQVIDANGLQNRSAALKLLATRGSRTAPPWDHTLLVTARPYVHRLETIASDGIHLGTYPHPRQTPLANHKTLNYLYYLKAGQWALEQGCHEALVLNPDGTVSETNTANLLLVNAKEVIQPQSPAVLPGVMSRAAVRSLKAWGYDVIQRPVAPEELQTAEVLLAANALMGAVPITCIDNVPRPAGGDLWQRLNDAVIPGWRQ